MPSIACELQVILYGRDISIQFQISNKRKCCKHVQKQSLLIFLTYKMKLFIYTEDSNATKIWLLPLWKSTGVLCHGGVARVFSENHMIKAVGSRKTTLGTDEDFHNSWTTIGLWSAYEELILPCRASFSSAAVESPSWLCKLSQRKHDQLATRYIIFTYINHGSRD